MAKLKAAIIGTGGISNEHIMAYQKNENVELYAFCDIDEKKLRERGILVRHFTAPRIAAYNRITVGSRAEMEALVVALKEILEEEQ